MSCETQRSFKVQAFDFIHVSTLNLKMNVLCCYFVFMCCAVNSIM